MSHLVLGVLGLKKQMATLPERTGQMSCQPALGRAPAAHDSSPCHCQGEGGKHGQQQIACPLGKGEMFIAGVLTARGSAWVRMHGGCTACTGTHGRPGWRGSPAQTAGRPRAGAGSQSSLKQCMWSLWWGYSSWAVLVSSVSSAESKIFSAGN